MLNHIHRDKKGEHRRLQTIGAPQSLSSGTIFVFVCFTTYSAMSLFLICLLWMCCYSLRFASYRPILADNMGILFLFQDKVTRVNLGHNSKRELLIESDADLSRKEVNDFHVVI